MCYSARYRLEIALKRARYWNNMQDIEHFERELERYDEQYAADGFAHPETIIYQNSSPYKPVLSQWGLIPHWSQSGNYKDFRANTLNAAAETIFTKASFKHSARHKRCIIPAEGYYEYHYYKGKKYPFYIYRRNNAVMNFAGLWSEWTDKETGEIHNTFTIITTRANNLSSKIHNNPKFKVPRMPVILHDGKEDDWLAPWKSEKDNSFFENQLTSYPEDDMQAHTVRKLKGKDSPGNAPEANEKFEYKELAFD